MTTTAITAAKDDADPGDGALLARDLHRRDFLRMAGGAVAGAAAVGALPKGLLPGGAARLTSSSSKSVHVGGIFALTGPASYYGQGAHDAFTMLVDTVNSSGGIKSLGGAKITTSIYNGAGSNTTSESLAEQAYANGAVAIVGCGTGTCSLGVGLAAGRLGKVFVSGDPSLHIAPEGKYIYVCSPQTTTYAQLAVDGALAAAKSAGKSIKTAAISYIDIVDFSTAIPPTASYLKSKGITVVANVSYPVTQSTYGSIVSQLKSSGADLYMQFGLPTDVVAIVKEMSVLGYNPKSVVGVIGGYSSNTLLSGVGALGTGLMGACQFVSTVDNSAVKNVVKDWNKVVGTSRPIDPYSGECVTAFAVLLDALERAGSTSTPALAKALDATDLKFGTPWIVIPGGAKFNSKRENATGTGVVYQIQSGKIVPVYPPSAAGTNKAVYPKPAWAS